MTEIEYFNKIVGDINKAVSTVEVASEDADRKIANIYRMVIAQQLCNLVDLEREALNKNGEMNKELISKIPAFNNYTSLPPELMTVEEHNEILRSLAKRVDEYLLFGDDNRSLVISSINDLLPVKERYVRKGT